MTRTELPLLLLAEPVAKRQPPQARITFADAAFLLSTMIIVVGGCLFLLDMASARSSGQVPISNDLFANMSTWLPTLLGSAKYVLLLVASILNSALIVALVYSLRSIDRGVRRATNRASFTLTPLRQAQTVRRQRGRYQATPSYLLSPLFR